MKTINQDELFHNVKQFLQSRGVDLKEGSYTHRLHQCCGLLTDVVNTTNKTVSRACAEIDRKLKDVRDTIRRRTSPRTSDPKGTAASTAAPPSTDAFQPGASEEPPKTTPKPPRRRAAKGAEQAASKPAKRKVARKRKTAG